MKRMIALLGRLIVGFVLILISASWAVSQVGLEKGWQYTVSLGVNVNQLYGDLKEANRQYAADQGTIWGQTGSYDAEWKMGLVVNAGARRWVFRHFGFSVGCNVGSFGTGESLVIDYEPAFQGYVRKTERVTSQLLYASPRLGLVGRWRNIGFEGGITANVFLTGKTTWENRLELADGSSETEIREGRFDTQDPPVYADPAAPGGIVDYTYLNPRNHGANPIWLSAFVGARYSLWKDRPSPFVLFDWNFALSEAIRARTPYFSLRNFVQSPLAEDIQQGTRFKGFSVGLGYRF
jgi:hypothetical protein